MTHSLHISGKRSGFKQAVLWGAILVALTLLPIQAVADDEEDLSSVPTADLETPDGQGTELNVPHAGKAQPVSSSISHADIKPAADPQNLMAASLAAAGVYSGSAGATPKPEAKAVSNARPQSAPKSTDAKSVASKLAPAHPAQAARPAPVSAPTAFEPLEASASRALEAGDYVKVRVSTKSDAAAVDTVVQIGPTGEVTLPYVGHVKLAGLFVPVALETLTLRYADGFYINPRVSVVLMRPASEGAVP